MFIFIVIIVIALVSVFLSFLSIIRLKDKSEVKNVKKELSKNRIVYQDTSSSSRK